jgi:diguanylate cyclase (GGDEF)-like protein
LQTTTFLGLALIALAWGGVEFYLSSERSNAEASAIKSTTNLARLFEEQIIRLIKVNDRVLRQLQLSSVNDTLLFDFNRWAFEFDDSSDSAAQLTLLNADGIVLRTNGGSAAEGLDLSDREHFRVHRESAEVGLFVSKPVLSRISGKWSILLTRALRAPHGKFSGVVAATIATDKLTRFYETVDLGPHGAVNLVGFDGIVRASVGMKTATVGKSMANTVLQRSAAKAEEGWFKTPGTIDGVRRIMSYRVVDGFPLVLSVGRGESEILGDYWHRRDMSRAVASGLTLFILIVIGVNVRHRRGLERARAESRASDTMAREKSHELELTLDHMSQGIMMIDAERRVAVVNRRAVELLDLPESVYSRPSFSEVMAYHLAHEEFGRDGGLVAPQLWEAIQAEDFYAPSAYERTRPNGVTLEVRTSNLPDGGIVRTFTDISERKRNEDKIAHMAHHDALTGLANRTLLRSHIEMALRRERRQGEGFALLLVDLDHFKWVNDTLGHGAGDELLNCVGQRLKSCVRDTDIVARFGGDEFAVLQAAPAGREGIETLARRLVEVTSAPYTLDGSEVIIGTSIGVARSQDNADIEQLFHNADLALYRVKAEGRNGFRLFEPGMDEAAQARRQMEDDLRQAQARGEFEIHYQPMFDLVTRTIVCVEALLRWNRPGRGQIPPADFLPLAEEFGLMTSIDAWVLETACTQAARWPRDIKVAINLSPTKFNRSNLLEVVERALVNSGLSPQRLELEISERILLQKIADENLATLHALRDLRVRIALDDFGTGFSSLSDLRLFSFDKIKIDQSFVAEIESRKDCAAIVAAIAGLGRSLSVDTVAEGVETEAQATLVQAAGCTQVQGYLYGRPVDAGTIRTLLDDRSAQRAIA